MTTARDRAARVRPESADDDVARADGPCKSLDGVCQFDEPYRGACGSPPATDDPILLCDGHRGENCVVCGDQAVRGCSATHGFVCGAPLCDDHDLNDCTFHS